MPYAERPMRGRHPWYDQKAPDGYTVNGWRKIAQDGSIKFGHTRHYHESFKEWVGLYVFIEIDDPYGINVFAWPGMPWKNSREMLRCANEEDWKKGQHK